MREIRVGCVQFGDPVRRVAITGVADGFGGGNGTVQKRAEVPLIDAQARGQFERL